MTENYHFSKLKSHLTTNEIKSKTNTVFSKSYRYQGDRYFGVALKTEGKKLPHHSTLNKI